MSVGRGIGRAWLTAAGLLVATATAALAGAPTEQVRQYTDHVQRILHDTSLPQADKRAAVSKIAHEVFDLTETARRALGRHWQGRTPAQQAEFVQLFADLLERTYVARSSPGSARRFPSRPACTSAMAAGSFTTSSSRVSAWWGTIARNSTGSSGRARTRSWYGG